MFFHVDRMIECSFFYRTCLLFGACFISLSSTVSAMFGVYRTMMQKEHQQLFSGVAPYHNVN